MTKTAVTYTRVSSKKQLSGNGLDDQLTACRNYAAAHDLEIIQEFADKGKSGASNKRPEFDKLRAMAGEVDAVIIPVHSRFSRAEDVLSTLTLMQEIEKAGTEIHVTNRGQVTTLTMTGMIIAVVDLYQASTSSKS